MPSDGDFVFNNRVVIVAVVCLTPIFGHDALTLVIVLFIVIEKKRTVKRDANVGLSH